MTHSPVYRLLADTWFYVVRCSCGWQGRGWGYAEQKAAANAFTCHTSAAMRERPARVNRAA